MKKTKHTPGPWHINHWSNEAGRGVYCKELNRSGGISYYTGDAVTAPIYGIRSKIDQLAHTVEGSFEGAHICDINDRNAESKANAKLIAAAPQLLKALQSLTEEVSRSCSIGSDPSLLELLKEWQNAMNAIKTATE